MEPFGVTEREHGDGWKSQAMAELSLKGSRALDDDQAVELLLASGLFGLVELNEQMTVIASSGLLVDWVEVGLELGEAIPALVGYEDSLMALRRSEQDGFRLPRVRFAVGDGAEPRIYSIRASAAAAPGHVILLFQDATDLGTLEQKVLQQRNELALTQQALQAASDKADAANRAKSAFLANVSHELRTPLTVIIGNTEILMGRAMADFEPGRLAEFITDTHDNGVFLLEMINDLLDLSKAEAGRIDLNEESFPLGELLDEVLALVRGLPLAAALTLRRSDRARPLRLRADRLRIKQILINILTNAVKFTPEGGSITVDAVLEAESGLVIEIADSGVGMTEAELARLSERFVQGSQSARSGGGSGLGLHLVASLMELHGGSMSHDGAPGRGTIVRLRFPAERASEGG